MGGSGGQQWRAGRALHHVHPSFLPKLAYACVSVVPRVLTLHFLGVSCPPPRLASRLPASQRTSMSVRTGHTPHTPDLTPLVA